MGEVKKRGHGRGGKVDRAPHQAPPKQIGAGDTHRACQGARDPKQKYMTGDVGSENPQNVHIEVEDHSAQGELRHGDRRIPII